MRGIWVGVNGKRRLSQQHGHSSTPQLTLPVTAAPSRRAACWSGAHPPSGPRETEAVGDIMKKHVTKQPFQSIWIDGSDQNQSNLGTSAPAQERRLQQYFKSCVLTGRDSECYNPKWEDIIFVADPKGFINHSINAKRRNSGHVSRLNLGNATQTWWKSATSVTVAMPSWACAFLIATHG